MKFITLFTCIILSNQAIADMIDFGQASQYNAFIQGDYQVTSSDVEGRIAIGNNLTVNGGYDIGTKITDFAMGDGPSLVVGGNINKTGSGFLNVYNSSSLPNPVLGDIVAGGNINGDNILASSRLENSPESIDFTNAFAHLNNLSEQLSARTSAIIDDSKSWRLDFKVNPDDLPSDNVYVFNVEQAQIRTDWYLDTTNMVDDATVVFNISHSDNSTVDFTQSNLYLDNSSDPLSAYFNKGSANDTPPLQVLYNFYGASQLNLNTDLYGSILAPDADIVASPSVIWGQVIGKSWQGNMQINYNAFTPVGTNIPTIAEPNILWLFMATLMVLIIGRLYLSYPHK